MVVYDIMFRIAHAALRGVLIPPGQNRLLQH